MPGGASSKGWSLRLGRVRRVVGRDRVDGALAQLGDERVADAVGRSGGFTLKTGS